MFNLTKNSKFKVGDIVFDKDGNKFMIKNVWGYTPPTYLLLTESQKFIYKLR